jgi:hypothetical protein
MNEVKNALDKFVQRYFDLEVIVSSEAREHRTKSQLTFSDLLRRRVVAYMGCLDKGKEPDTNMMRDCFNTITGAYANGFLIPGQDLLRKLDESRQQNRELTKDLAICMANYTALQNEHNRLLKMLDQNQTQDWKKQEEESS